MLALDVFTQRIRLLLCLSVLVLAAGCGDSGPALGEVTGIVTLDGQPLSDMVVTFLPETGGRASTGYTDADGKFEAHFTGTSKGAIVGGHKITVTPVVPDVEDGLPFTKAFPRKYQDMKQTELRQEVKPGSNDITVELVSK